MFGSMNFVAENISNHEFFDETRLKQIFEPVLRGNLLSLAHVIDDLPDVAH